ncbi:YbaB/EbfC family nucleoid-associated protein [Psychroflexus salis]|uniref:Nucleoid-associated protein GCM10010831_09720 n=1 Tax=Psychroflexus salis TaxID=1526574 RepID=A0A916ZRA2_9FLAO|nr:YbaB/EbfC family nucleoid-associated protein [Psychroflexus salis]GGE10282.1 nucleoid-associated protein [Psychroflexus salis]
MFGDMMGMMQKVKQAQQKVEETKKRLDSVFIKQASEDELLKIEISANRNIKKIEVADELLKDKEQLEDYLIVHINKAIQRATEINDAEISAVAKEGMPNIPGLT